MARKRDYYEVLNVPRSATSKEIERAYRQQESLLEPDAEVSRAASDQLQELDAAYMVLSDPTRRDAYDRTGLDLPVDRERTDDQRSGPTVDLRIARHLLWLLPAVCAALASGWNPDSRFSIDTFLPFLALAGGAAAFALILGLAIRWRRGK